MCRVQPGLQLADAHLILVLEVVPGVSSFLSSSSLAPRVSEPLVSRLKVMGTQLWPAASILVLVSQVRVSIGSRSVLSFITIMSLAASATEMELSCPTQASLLPSPEKLTACTQPPPFWELENSVMRFPMGILLPQAVGDGLASISFINPE